MKHSDIIYIMGVRCIRLADGRLVQFNVQGRPPYGVIYGERTVPVHVPVSLLPELEEKMEALRVKEAELQAAIRADVLYTSPGYRFSDLPTETLIPRFNDLEDKI